MTQINRVRWSLNKDPIHQKFVAERLLALKAALESEIHGATSERSLRLATWNIMHFGDGGGYQRSEEAMLFIAEIIDHFDLVAVQEVNRNLAALESLVNNYLGKAWDYLVTDTAGGHGSKTDAGNNERLAFLYRRGKVQFEKEVGEIVLPTGQEIAAPGGDGTVGAKVQFARTPFSVAFKANWLSFKLCTVHIFYGKDGDNTPEMEQRRAEIQEIAKFLSQRQEGERKARVDSAKANNWTNPEEGGHSANYILLGDFNIISPEHKTMKALEDNGFTVATKPHRTDLSGNHHYDQIAYKAAHPDFKVINSGVFSMLDHVYRDEDAAHYIDHLKVERIIKGDNGPRPREKAEAYFKQYYRRHQMSDHKLLWCEIAIDYSGKYLQNIIDS